MRLEEERVKTINSYRGIIVNTSLDYARLPDGSMALREVVEHPGGVAVLPLEDDGTVWCVRQYRYPFSETLLEVPAGKLEPGEEPETAARRELSEEALRREGSPTSAAITAHPATTARCCTFISRRTCATAPRTRTRGSFSRWRSTVCRSSQTSRSEATCPIRKPPSPCSRRACSPSEYCFSARIMIHSWSILKMGIVCDKHIPNF